MLLHEASVGTFVPVERFESEEKDAIAFFRNIL